MNDCMWNYMVEFLSGNFHDAISAEVMATSPATTVGNIVNYRVIKGNKNA